MGSIHMTVNRGKRSIQLDLKRAEDAEILRGLIAEADIFIHNVRATAIEKLGFGYDAVKALKPDLIYLHCTGFGQGGPYEDLQAYDDLIQAATGTAALLPLVDGNPRLRYLPSLIADKVSGMFGAQAMLAALVHRLRTGEGQHVEVPMFEAFTSFMFTEHLRDAVFDPPIGSIGYPRQIDPTRQPFPTKDGYISIVPYTDDKIVALFNLIGASDVLNQPGMSTREKRLAVGAPVYEELAKITPERTTAEWMELLTTNNIPALAACSLDDVLHDPHLQATGFFRPRTHPDSGAFREMRPPIRFSADPDRELGFAPKLDQHGAEIRAEMAQKVTKTS